MAGATVFSLAYCISFSLLFLPGTTTTPDTSTGINTVHRVRSSITSSTAANKTNRNELDIY